MTIDEAEEIISKYEYWKDRSCTCFRNPPCGKCTEQPSEDLYKESLIVLNEFVDW